jgi:hypothetical protein
MARIRLTCMFFRFGAAVLLVVAVSLLGIALEKRNLSLRRTISLQLYRAEQLQERCVRLRLQSEQLGAPARLMQAIEDGRLEVTFADQQTQTRRR